MNIYLWYDPKRHKYLSGKKEKFRLSNDTTLLYIFANEEAHLLQKVLRNLNSIT